MFQATAVSRIGRSSACCQTSCAPSRSSSNGWRGVAGVRTGSCKRSSSITAAPDNIAARTKAAGAPAHATSAPASAGPAAKAALRASSSRLLA